LNRLRPVLPAAPPFHRYFDRKGEVPPGKKPFFAIPVFNYYKGYLSINYSDNYYLLSQRHAEVPRLTKVRGSSRRRGGAAGGGGGGGGGGAPGARRRPPGSHGPAASGIPGRAQFANLHSTPCPLTIPPQAHYEAMELFNQLAASDELRLDHMLQPGEIQVLSNHTQLHTRAAFEDWDDVDQRRHLLRLWLAPEGERPLPESYKEIYGGGVEVGGAPTAGLAGGSAVQGERRWASGLGPPLGVVTSYAGAVKGPGGPSAHQNSTPGRPGVGRVGTYKPSVPSHLPPAPSALHPFKSLSPGRRPRRHPCGGHRGAHLP
jgi:hypothetical protein